MATHRLSFGDRVMYTNLVCIIVGIEHKGSKTYYELQPVGSSARVSAESSQVNQIMTEGNTEDLLGEPLYD